MITSERRRGVWRDAVQIFPELWSFVKRPSIGEADTKWTPLIWRQLFMLFLFDLVLIVPMVMYGLGYEELLTALGTEKPEHHGFDEYESLWTLFLIVGIVAPLVEEPLFRGWLQGTPRQLMLLTLPVVAFLLLFLLGSADDLPSSVVRLLTVASFMAFVGACLEIFHRTRPDDATVSLFGKYFSLLFWTSALLFGFIHMTNYEGGSLWTIAPMVLPQLLIGPVWAFARLRFGLRASILLHSASNSSLVLLWAAAELFSGS